jgi:hypothetical protein
MGLLIVAQAHILHPVANACGVFIAGPTGKLLWRELHGLDF